MRALLLLLCFASLALCAYHSNVVLQTESGSVEPSSIYYTNNYFSLQNIENPISAEIKFTAGDADTTASICLVPNQKDYPVPGNNLQNSCPTGGFAPTVSNATNTTSSSTKLKFTRMTKDSVRGQLLSKMVTDTDTNAVNLIGQPSNKAAGFVITTTSTTTASFTVTLIGSYCDPPQFAVNGTCVDANEITTGIVSVETVPAGSWGFYYFTTTFVATENNQVNVDYNLTTGNFYIQQNYLPTADWNIGQTVSPQIINTPGVFGTATTWYIGVDNTAGTVDLPFSVNVTFVACDTGLVGPSCAVNSTATNTTDGSTVILLDANAADNLGVAQSFDISDDSYQYIYFQLYNLPTFNESDSYYIRVSVGNNELEDDEDNFGPTLYAKLNGFPSAESNDYAVGGAVSNQVYLYVTSTDDVWYLAVPAPSDFSIWIGTNCAGSCDHGSCLCSASATNGTTVDCGTLYNTTNTYPLYESLPYSTVESAGSCTCSDDDYAESFDCSQKSSPTVLFIVLIVIGGLIILFVAIGVPLYCYISNKRKERYERI